MNYPDKAAIHRLPLANALAFYNIIIQNGDQETIRWLCRNDRYFLLVAILGRTDMCNQWCYERTREVEADPDGHIDLWSREHYKSTIITWAGSIQEILKDPDITIIIMSYNSATARAFVTQIKTALEMPVLKQLFPEILWEKPPSAQWSVQRGLWVKRSTTAKEPTLSGSGLVDGMPTGGHYMLRIYDDVVTPESITSPEQIQKTTDAFRLSAALGAGEDARKWIIGTRYHPMDTYQDVIKSKVATERRRICVDSDGNPTLFSREKLENKARELGPRLYAAQMMQEPTGEGVRMFKDEWVMYYDRQPERRRLNVYIIIDSANGKRKNNDYTTMWVIGLAADGNYYILDCIRDRMDLVQRTDALFHLHRKWKPLIVFWEQVGAMSDAAHVRDIQERENYRFRIVEIPQHVNKQDRIGWLVPLFSAARMWFPRRLLYMTVTGDTRDLIQDFITDELFVYPVVRHDDMLDNLANVKHPSCAEMKFPKLTAEENRDRGGRSNSNWDPYA